MKRFACGDVVPGCQASWVCSTEEELLAQVAAHACADHGIAEVTPELGAQVQQHITTV